MVTEHGTLFIFSSFICFYFHLKETVAFTSGYVLPSVFWTLVMIRSVLLLKKKKKKKKREDVSRYAGFWCSFWFPVCINCQSNKCGSASQKWRVHCVKHKQYTSISHMLLTVCD